MCVFALLIRWSILVIHTALLWRGEIWQKLSNTEKMLRAQVISWQNTQTENQNVVTMCHIKYFTQFSLRSSFTIYQIVKQFPRINSTNATRYSKFTPPENNMTDKTRHSLAYLSVPKWFTGNVANNAKNLAKTDQPSSKKTISDQYSLVVHQL